MSTSNTQSLRNKRPKFTRGEKCIFIHLVLTFALILIIVLIYLIHLYAINHTVYDVFKTRRSFESTANLQIGMAYIKLESPMSVCNTILFTTSWSIAPGFCVAMRTERDMANEFSLWRIKYTSRNSNNDALKIIRTIVFPLFNRYSLSHNIGLFQHEPKDINDFIPIIPPLNNMYRSSKDMLIGTWTEAEGGIFYCPITIMEKKYCDEIISFIADIREYEFCASFTEKHEITIEHGALITKNNKLTGIFSWGDKNGKVLPFVILNISFYQSWIRQQTQSNPDIDENSI